MAGSKSASKTDLPEKKEANPDVPTNPDAMKAVEGQHGQTAPADFPINYPKGLQFWMIVFCINMSFFVSNIEIPIVTTALVGITSDIGGFDRAPWIISAYLLGYAGVIIVFAKLSDIFGRKLFFILAVGIFTVFSAAAGAAQNITQLIIFRAFQGIGGAGCYALSAALSLEVVPPEGYAAILTLIAFVYCLSLVLGPIFGGLITDHTTWRWIFLMNVPAGVLTIAIAWWFIPNNFPYHGHDEIPIQPLRSLFSRSVLRRVDFIGSLLLIIGTLALVAALVEAGLFFSWDSGYVTSLLSIGGVFWIAVLLWERYVTRAKGPREPVIPWRFIADRRQAGVLLNALFLGAPWFVTIFQLPQRFQILYGSSPVGSGLRLMPFTVSAPIAAVIVSAIVGKGVPPIYFILFAGIFQVIGLALLGTMPYSESIPNSLYGYQVIAGIGCGLNSSMLPLYAPFIVESQDKPVALGSIAQLRVMGGAIGLAIVTAVRNQFLGTHLQGLIPQSVINSILRTNRGFADLDAQTLVAIRPALSEAYNLQMKILAGLAAGQILATMLMWQRKQVKVL